MQEDREPNVGGHDVDPRRPAGEPGGRMGELRDRTLRDREPSGKEPEGAGGEEPPEREKG